MKSEHLPRSSLLVASVMIASCLFCVVSKASTLPVDTSLQAQTLAESTPWQQPRAATVHPLGVQTLSVERKENKREPGLSHISVYQFNYQLAQARVLSIDVSDNRVLKNQPISSVHLPLSNEEISYARRALSAQEDILRRLRNEQVSRGRTAFSDLSQLDVKSSIFEPLETSHPCHWQRCALMSLFDESRTVFSIEPVINLQTMQVELLKR